MFNQKFYNIEETEQTTKTINDMVIFLLSVPTSADKVLRKHLIDTINIQNPTEKELLIKGGMFKIEHLALYLNNIARKNDTSVPVGFLEHALQQCIYFGIIEPMRAAGLPWLAYQVLMFNIRKLPNMSLLPVIYGQNYIIKEASKYTFQICVEKNKDSFSGTGFYSTIPANNKNTSLIITNKHVVNPDIYTITEIKNASSIVSINDIKKIVCSDTYDLALIFLNKEEQKTTGLNLLKDKSEILSDILTIGYPNVANTFNDSVLVHAGQINGNVNLTNGQRSIVISADVAPGNSGCPVINELGQVIGLVTEDLESKRMDSNPNTGDEEVISSIHHAAVPSSYITDFINQEI